MIVDNIKVNDITSTGFLRSENMSIDANSLKHIMKTLTNLYSDPVSAVIREYSTNAYDAHFEAGTQDIPIEITMPSVFSPMFKVKDFGTGLSLEEVYNIYGRYGASTKRLSNNYVGQLGLGCKSALTLSDQFSMVSTKDGMKYVFNISMNEEGIPAINLRSQTQTQERNGVEVIIPIAKKDLSQFARAAKYFYYFAPMPVNIDKEPASRFAVKELAYDVSNRIKVYKKDMYGNEGVGNGYVVMGGVPYKINREYMLNNFSIVPDGMELIIKADIGDVNFTPSREDLHYTDKTNNFLNAAKIELDKNLYKAVQDQVNSYSTYIEAYKSVTDLFSQYTISKNFSNLNYKGFSFSLNDLLAKKEINFDVYELSYGTFSTISFRDRQVFQGRNPNNIIIVEGKAKDLNSVYKKKLKMWAAENKIQSGIFMYFSSSNGGVEGSIVSRDVFKGCQFITNEKDLKPFTFSYSKSNGNKDVRYEKVTGVSHSHRSRNKFKLVTSSEKSLQTDKIIAVGTNQDIMVLFNKVNKRQVQAILENFNIYKFPKNSMKKMIKDRKAVYVMDAVKTKATHILQSMTKDDIKNSTDFGTYNRQHFVYLEKKTIDAFEDEDLKTFYNTYMNKEAQVKEDYNMWFDLLRTFYPNDKVVLEVEKFVKDSRDNLLKEVSDLMEKISKKYPMLKARTSQEDIISYVNNH